MRILLATDGSDEARMAARRLAELPFPGKPTLTIVSALRESPLDLRTNEEGAALYEAEKKQTNAHVDELKRELASHFEEIDHVVKFCHPNELILHVAEDRDVDLIVLGARGHNAIYRVIVGSTAEYVANHAKCSVLIVRGDQPSSSQWRLLLPFDGSQEARQAYQELSTLNWPQASELHVAMMLERPNLIPDDYVYDPPAIDEAEQQIGSLDAKQLGLTVNHVVSETRHAASSLVELARKKECNLILLGATGKSAVARFFLGSVSRYLLHHAQCSLWLARKKE